VLACPTAGADIYERDDIPENYTPKETILGSMKKVLQTVKGPVKVFKGQRAQL
jgi:hypothetical protein